MRRFSVFLLSILLAAGAVAARAQAVPAATARQFSITAGGMASIFQPDFAGGANWTCATTCNSPTHVYYYPVASASNQPLFGAGAYVDVKFTRWIQIEAEGRWLRFNQYEGISQDDYLIGPRAPVYRLGRSELYAKALIGYSNMTFAGGEFNKPFTNLAFGGGMDVKLTKRISFRAFDFEYQYWPVFGNSTSSPYGASMGIGYKIF